MISAQAFAHCRQSRAFPATFRGFGKGKGAMIAHSPP
jgi:hypothetical protein